MGSKVVRAIDENGLIDIANILQKMVGAEKRFTKFEDMDLETNNDLRTCVAMIVRVNEEEILFDLDRQDMHIENLNQNITELINLIELLPPQVSNRLALIKETQTKIILGTSQTIRELNADLQEWQEATKDLLDELMLAQKKLPEATTRPVNWKARYIAKYVAQFYKSELKTWPRNTNGNPTKRFIKAVDEICSILKLDFAAAKYACRQVLNLIDEGGDLAPPIL